MFCRFRVSLVSRPGRVGVGCFKLGTISRGDFGPGLDYVCVDVVDYVVVFRIVVDVVHRGCHLLFIVVYCSLIYGSSDCNS